MSFGVFILFTIMVALIVWYAITNIAWAIRGETWSPLPVTIAVEGAGYVFIAYSTVFTAENGWKTTICWIYLFFITNVILAQWIICAAMKAMRKRNVEQESIDSDDEPQQSTHEPESHFNDVAYRTVDMHKLMQKARDELEPTGEIYRWGLDTSVTVIAPKSLLDKLEQWSRGMPARADNRGVRSVIFNNLHHMYFVAVDDDDLVMGIKVIPTDDVNYAHYILPVYYWSSDAKRFFTKNIGLAVFVGNGCDNLPAGLMKCSAITDSKSLYQYIKERFL